MNYDYFDYYLYYYAHYRDWSYILVFSVCFALLALFIFAVAVFFMIFRNDVRKMLISLSVASSIYVVGAVTVAALCDPLLLGFAFIPIMIVSALAIALSDKRYAMITSLSVSLPCLLASIVLLAASQDGGSIMIIQLIVLLFEMFELAIAVGVKYKRVAKKYMEIANRANATANATVAANANVAVNAGAPTGEGAATGEEAMRQQVGGANDFDYSTAYAVDDDISVREVSSTVGVSQNITQWGNKKSGTNKSVKSSKIQLAIVWLVPSVITYLGVILCAITKFDVGALWIFIVVGVLGSAVGAYIIGNSITGLLKVKPPQRSILNLTVGNTKFKAATSRKASSETAAQTRGMIITMLTVIWLVPVAAAGWLLFILYCNKKFMGKLLTMAEECDRADDIILTRQGSLDEIAYCFYRMIDYAYVYIDINERKGSKEMLDRAENLLGVWTVLYPDA